MAERKTTKVCFSVALDKWCSNKPTWAITRRDSLNVNTGESRGLSTCWACDDHKDEVTALYSPEVVAL